jgi:hypothetical protein
VKVTEVTVYTAAGPAGKGYVVVTFSSNGTGTPNCASGYPKNLLIDNSSGPSGAFAAAVVQSAMLSVMTVTVTGTGSCSVNPAMETMASIQETGR